MSNWKMFGLTTKNGITLIPCYYDLLRYRRKLTAFYKKRLNFVQFKVVNLRYKALFDTTIKI